MALEYGTIFPPTMIMTDFESGVIPVIKLEMNDKCYEIDFTSSFEIHDESTLDETDSSEDLSEDEFEASECHEYEESAEAMEESDSHSESQEETIGSDGQSGEEFSLDYMKKVLNYYDETDKNGKRAHSWKTVAYRFRCIRHQ
ncbi:unnamed protein product [Rotaria sordida]|uniref:Uncharacterized protein n=1 Tax=Rotaria sordida TaxID=392033 RepID=A0A814XD67_9BILA|nr:unnamed protein product [Rotaria sordida]CAF1214727.1 unnamed protein product [Rotaria sordida]CAF1271207.1 unnamed protein product [Rotaria sordida]CAF3859318.1 unnamed protein product [Rotaria sordida]